MIWDTFMFRNEFDCLEIRLHELAPYVDRFVLVEGAFTFQGGEKPLQFGVALETHSLPPGVEEFRSRLDYIPVLASPGTEDPWTRESYQRNAIGRGLVDAADDDVVLIGDVDEIPRGAALERAIAHLPGVNQVSLEQVLSFYHVNVRNNAAPWYGTQVLRADRLRDVGAQEARVNRAGNIIEPQGGWHFCNLGDAAWLIEKIESFSHTEVNLPEYKDPELLEACIRESREMTGRADVTFIVEDTEDLPQYVLDNRERFAHWFAPVKIEAT